MSIELLLFPALLFVIAFLYASVGHGGASGYLAIMAIFSFSPDIMKPTALMLNLFVSLVSFVQFYRGGHFKWNYFWPFALASIPASYLGGRLSLDHEIYRTILGVFLVFAVLRFVFFKNTKAAQLRQPNIGLSLVIGGLIGFLSGLLGIGGGIILSPIILLLKWTDQKQTAAISALFILVNSLAALAGLMSKPITFSADMIQFVVLAFLGGLCGAWFGAIRLPQHILKYILAVVLALAAYKLLFTHA